MCMISGAMELASSSWILMAIKPRRIRGPGYAYTNIHPPYGILLVMFWLMLQVKIAIIYL